MSIAYVSLGSNLGDRLGYLAAAVARLNDEQTRVVRVSSVYETAPQGKTDQPDFLNMAVAVETALDPIGLLEHIQRVERSLGRIRLERWGPRTIDLDILLYGPQQVYRSESLEVPHPRLAERAFVLTPLLELNPDLVLPTAGRPLMAFLGELPDQGVTLHLHAESFLQRSRGVQ